MPLSRDLARFNRRVTNRLVLRLAGWVPGLAIVHHLGRKSRRAYRTPVNVFRHDDTYLIPLTYGRAEWVKNILAAGGCSIRTRARDVELTDPRIHRDPDRDGVPAPVGWILGLIDVDEFLTMRTP